MTVRVVQLTDLHLFSWPEGKLAGVRTWDTFRQVLSKVRREQPFEWMVLTGDLAQDESLPTYEALKAALGDWVTRCRIIPGNHDNRDALREVFPACYTESIEDLVFNIALDHWRIIGLDTHDPGKTTGRIGDTQLAWLERVLSQKDDRGVLIFLHHPPVSIRSVWLDALGLTDAKRLLELVATKPNVKIICAGHVHQAFETRSGGITFYTTPSTCVQFAGGVSKAFDRRAAGFRSFDLAADSHTTQVHRLSDT